MDKLIHYTTSCIENSISSKGGYIGAPVYVNLNFKKKANLPNSYDTYIIDNSKNTYTILPTTHKIGNKITLLNIGNDDIVLNDRYNLLKHESLILYNTGVDSNKNIQQFWTFFKEASMVKSPKIIVPTVTEITYDNSSPIMSLDTIVNNEIYDLKIHYKKQEKYKFQVIVKNNNVEILTSSRYNSNKNRSISIAIYNNQFCITINNKKAYCPIANSTVQILSNKNI